MPAGGGGGREDREQRVVLEGSSAVQTGHLRGWGGAPGRAEPAEPLLGHTSPLYNGGRGKPLEGDAARARRHHRHRHHFG